jgi:NAD(P)-dependent dehydrogenase (short-subunit alcohol dehydrogenase family)
MLFDLTDRVVVITGATGALAGSVADYLAEQNARVVYLGRNQAKLDAALKGCLTKTPNAQCLGLVADVLDRPALGRARDAVLQKWGRIDGLVNGAGGNMPGATIPPEKSFSDLDFDAFQQVVDLNLHGTVLPSLVFTPAMMEGGRGSIVNFSSVSAPQAVTRVVGYSAAKSAVENFTRWLALDMGRRTGGKVRVNAVLPGFFLGEQNSRLLTNEDGSLTERGQLSSATRPSVASAKPTNCTALCITCSPMRRSSSPVRSSPSTAASSRSLGSKFGYWTTNGTNGHESNKGGASRPGLLMQDPQFVKIRVIRGS